MISSKINPPVSLITNYVTVKSENGVSCTASNSVCLINSVCLVLAQYVSKLRNILSYNIYIINNIECNIYNVYLMDTLPEGVKFVSTSVENGQYKHCKDKIFYDVPIIESHSFCKIVINVCPKTLGKKINSIKVLGKKSKYIIHNPAESCIVIRLRKRRKMRAMSHFLYPFITF